MKVGGALALERLLYIVKGNLERLFSVPVRIKSMSEYFFLICFDRRLLWNPDGAEGDWLPL